MCGRAEEEADRFDFVCVVILALSETASNRFSPGGGERGARWHRLLSY